VTPLNCLREFTKAKQGGFSGRELRYLKLLAGRLLWSLSIGVIWKTAEHRFLDLPATFSVWISFTKGTPGRKQLDVCHSIQTCHKSLIE
jgi:hypothetical protein